MSYGNMPSPSEPHTNPYAAGTLAPPPPSKPDRRKMPVFPMVMFILSLVFVVLRIPFVLFGFIALTVMAEIPPAMMNTVPYELASGSAVVAFGLAANILLLLKKRAGVSLGWFLAAALIFSITVGIWQGSIQAGTFRAGSPERIGAYVGVGIAFIFRVGLLVMYVTALVWFTRWLGEPTETP